MLVGRWLDVYLMIFPSVVGEAPRIGLWEIGLTAGGIGCFGLLLVWILQRAPAVPIADPQLSESLQYERSKLFHQRGAINIRNAVISSPLRMGDGQSSRSAFPESFRLFDENPLKVAAIGSPPQQEEGWPKAGVVWSECMTDVFRVVCEISSLQGWSYSGQLQTQGLCRS